MVCCNYNGVSEPQFQGFIVVDDDDEGPCILFPFFRPDEKEKFDREVAAGKVEDGRKIFSHLWLENPVPPAEAEEIASKIKPFGRMGTVIVQ